MKPLGYFSERGGTTFAGIDCRQSETWKTRNEIDQGLDEYLDAVVEEICEDCETSECGICEKTQKVLVRIR